MFVDATLQKQEILQFVKRLSVNLTGDIRQLNPFGGSPVDMFPLPVCRHCDLSQVQSIDAEFSATLCIPNHSQA
jgi:hypothetical protein